MAPDPTVRPDVVVIGLGAMGLPLARRIGAVATVSGLEPDADRQSTARGHGVAIADPVALARTGTVLVMVSTGDQLAQVVRAYLSAARAGQTWVFSGTYGPAAVEDASILLRAQGADVLDAPVTGGVAGASSGTLHLFCGGPEDVLERVRPILSTFGTPHHVGAQVGDGQRLKAVNQLLCTVHLVAAAEALHLAERVGIAPSRALALLPGGAAGSWMLADRGPAMVHGSDTVRSAVDVFVKDADLVADLADDAHAQTPLLAAARTQIQLAAELGLGASDDSRLIDAYRHPGGLPEETSPR